MQPWVALLIECVQLRLTAITSPAFSAVICRSRLSRSGLCRVSVVVGRRRVSPTAQESHTGRGAVSPLLTEVVRRRVRMNRSFRLMAGAAVVAAAALVG